MDTDTAGSKQSGQQSKLTTFSARGVDRAIVKWLRVYAAQQERTIGELVSEALQLLRKHYEQGDH